jgi:uncharacterized protein (DUF1501 family)
MLKNTNANRIAGIARRDFLQAGALGVLGMAMSVEETAAMGLSGEKACILIFNSGGLSQLDSWDPKPHAPREVRSPFSAISTRGDFQVSGAFPQHAAIANLFSVVRGVQFQAAALHDVGRRLALTGQIAEGAPTVGGQGNVVISSAPESSDERYGRNPVGARFLQARRLIESGVRFVTLDPFGREAWDTHGAAPYATMDDFRNYLAPLYDQAASALIADLAERGLLDTTLVAAISEFGRTPWRNADGGRDHWAGCWSVYFAGGGVQGGRAIGRSDELGAFPEERGFSPQEVLATIDYAMGSVESSKLSISELF